MSVIADIAKDVLSSVYEIPSPSFEFTGPSADTSFSGSFVGELSFRSSSPPLEVVKVVLKHSDKRVDKLGVGEGGDVRDRAVKTDRSSVNEVSKEEGRREGRIRGAEWTGGTEDGRRPRYAAMSGLG